MALTLNVNASSPEDAPLVLAAEVVQAGGIIVYPTETLYGIGANALSPQTVARVQEIKGRTSAKPILVLVPDIEHLQPIVEGIPSVARRLIGNFWPGPLTLIFKATAAVPAELNLASGTIGVRVPSSPLCRRLLLLADCPMTSTSANRTGEPDFRSVSDIRGALGTAIDLYLDAGVLPATKPSSIVDVTGTTARLVREGAISLAQLREVVPDLTSAS